MSVEKLMLIDGNSILNRAFYGLQGPQLLATADGLYTNAVFGFLNILFKYLDEEKPQYLSVAFDLRAPTFRHLEYDGYKAKRKGMPPELAVQVPIIKEVLDAMNINRLEYEGYEADDIIGSVSRWAENKGIEVVVVTGDKDSLQLISSLTRIKLPVTRAGKTETEEYNIEKMKERYGVTPSQFIDVKGLMGDASDNIPGVPGIGEKTALDLITRFGSIESLYEKISQVDKKSVREKLESSRDMAFLSKRLATIERNMPEFWFEDELKRIGFNTQKLLEIFRRLEFKGLIEKLKLMQPSENTVTNTKLFECIKDIKRLTEVRNNIQLSKKFAFFHVMDSNETFSNKLSGFGMTWENGRSCYVDFNKCVDEEVFFGLFKELFEDEDVKKYGHDVKNLLVYLKSKGTVFAGLSFDTLIGAYIINPSRETYTVPELSLEYLKQDIQSIEGITGKGKNYTPFADIPLEKLSSLAGVYSEAIFDLWPILDGVIKDRCQRELFYDVELPLIHVLADMEFWGFKVNTADLKKFSCDLDGKLEIIESEIFEHAGEKFNINSPKQLGVILFEKLGLPVLKKTKTGYSTDAEVLEQLAHRHEMVSKLLEYRQLVKLKSTYAEGLQNVINPSTGKIHSNFNQTVTATGRISSTEPNLQNIPIKLEMGRKIRKVFIPSNESFLLMDADYSQIELRVLAHITGDENMISAFLNNEDIHTATASKIFGVSGENVTSLMRSRAKTVNFGIVYGIGDFSLSKDLGISRKEARKYIDEYLDSYPGVRKYMAQVIEDGRTNGYVSTMFNRRRYLPELNSSNFNIRSFGERVAMNAPIQGSAADIIKIAMVRVYKELKEKNLKSRLILQVHDELIIEVFRDETVEVAEILKDSMEHAIDMCVPLRTEIKTGANWYETK